MPLLRVSPSQKRALAIATVLAILVGAWLLQKYLMLIVVSAIVAYLFNPVYKWLLKKGRSQGQATLLTFLASLLAVIIPATLVILITVLQISSLINSISSSGFSLDLGKIGQSVIDAINSFMSSMNLPYHLTDAGIKDALTTAIKTMGQNLAKGVVSYIGNFFGFITTAIIYIYVFMSMLRHQDKIISTISKLNPLGEKVSELYLQRMSAMTKATVRGQFIIALCQGLESAVVLSLVGLDNLFFFFLVLLTALSVIPLGAGIVTIPIGIVMILSGQVAQGTIVVVNHLLIVTNIDNVLRPRLVPAEARLDSALMILAVFAGLAHFGFIGIVVGPVMMIVLVTTIQMFLEVYRDTKSLNMATKKKPRSLTDRFKDMVHIKQ
jgi:predicted PurR-regulated permease PerM